MSGTLTAAEIADAKESIAQGMKSRSYRRALITFSLVTVVCGSITLRLSFELHSFLATFGIVMGFTTLITGITAIIQRTSARWSPERAEALLAAHKRSLESTITG